MVSGHFFGIILINGVTDFFSGNLIRCKVGSDMVETLLLSKCGAFEELTRSMLNYPRLGGVVRFVPVASG